MAVTHITAGAVTDSSVVVCGQVSGVASVRVAVDTDEGMGAPAFYGPVTPGLNGMIRVPVAGLDASGRYFYQLETDSSLAGPVGQVRTCPPRGQGGSDILIAAGGDAGRTPDAPGVAGTLIPSRMSNHQVHSLIADQHDPLMWIHLGDEGYYNIGSGETWEDGGGSPIVLDSDLDTYRRQYADVFLQPHQAYLARRTARVHFWDDHEFGPNDSDRTAPGRDNACAAYREWEPHYPLPSSTAIHQWWQVDRVGYLGWDQRADRDPNDDPPGPGKTMIGAVGRSFTETKLAAARDEGVEFLVLVSPQSWLGLGADSWGLYTHERDLVVQMLGDHGWLGRCVMMCADIHILAIEDGSNNPFGGFPVFQFAPLDASPSNPPAHNYSLGFRTDQQSGQYGTLRLRDTGSLVEVTGTGWVNSAVWKSFQVSAGATVAPPPPAPAPIAQPTPRRSVTWLGVNSVTGRIIHELPDVRGQVRRLLSAYASSQLELPVPLSGPGHVPVPLLEQSTAPLTTALVAVVNDLPVWMGLVVPRQGGTGATVRLGAVTPEAYLRRRRVHDHTFLAADVALVAAALVADAETMTGVGSGLEFTLDVELTGIVLDRAYVATDRQPVYDALRELAALGLEFTVDLDWTDASQTAVRKLLRLKPRIGKPSGAALFETTAGGEATYELLEDFAVGRYANHVTVIAPGEGDDQPASAPAVDLVALAGGMPVVEHVVEVSSPAAATQAGLDDLAAAELARLRGGGRTWDISARLDAYPRLGVDVQLGDDVAWLLTGHRHPTGVTGAGRVIGYEVDEQAGRWRPTLLDPQEVRAMGVISDPAVSRGDIMRRLDELEAEVTALKTARRSERTAIGRGGQRVHSGGSVTVEGGGGIVVSDGGDVGVRGGRIIGEDAAGTRVFEFATDPATIFMQQDLIQGLVEAIMASPSGRTLSAQVFADRIQSASVATNETASSGTFGDLTTPGPAVTIEITAARAALVIVTARIHAGVLGTTSGGLMGFAVSGASAFQKEQANAATNIRFFADEGISDTQRASALSLITAADGLNAGTNTFTAKYATGGSGTATFQFRNITVIGF